METLTATLFDWHSNKMAAHPDALRFTERLKPCEEEFVVGDWKMHSGYRQVCDFYTQIWENLQDGRWACSCTQNRDWDGKEEPCLGIYSSYEELIMAVSSNLQ